MYSIECRVFWVFDKSDLTPVIVLACPALKKWYNLSLWCYWARTPKRIQSGPRSIDSMSVFGGVFRKKNVKEADKKLHYLRPKNE